MVLAVAQSAPIKQEIPIANLKLEYIDANVREAATNSIGDGNFFVFLQKFPLGGVDLFYHTEVVVCARDGFSAADQDFLDDKISKIGQAGFLQIEDSWWTTKTAMCVELGYGGNPCFHECCGVPHGSDQQNYQLKERRAVIPNADGNQKAMFIYG